jgi:glycosyltransferase involved in cell wall biosynthesis
MRILHVTESRSWSGGTVQLWNLCRVLRAHGHAVALVCPPDGELPRRLEGSGVEVTLCRMRQDYDLVAARRLAAVVRSFRPDVVHAHHPRAHALALVAGFLAPIPRLVVSRRVSFRLNRWNFFSQWKYRTSRIARYVAVSADIARVLAEGGVPADRIAVVRSGVDVDRFAPRPPDEAVRSALGLPKGRPLVGNLNHYSWWKGQPLFLEAAKLALDAGADAHFLLVGKDTDGAEAREKVRSLGLEGRVTLAGFRTDMPEVISILSVCVLSSLAGEGFSGVLRECMSMGVPVAATDVGGNRELVEDGRTGLLVPPGDAPALAAAIRRLLTEKDLARSCAERAQKIVRENFSIARMAEETERLYEQVLAG